MLHSSSPRQSESTRVGRRAAPATRGACVVLLGLCVLVTLFASIATPWGGMRFARMARLVAQLGGTFPPSWLDIAPDGEFVSKLLYRSDGTPRRLPPSVDCRLFFGYRGSHLDGYLNPVEHPADGVVSLASQLRIEARREAGGAVYAIDDHHTGILRNEETLTYRNAVFETARARDGGRDAG